MTPRLNIDDYKNALRKFDTATCDAIAVSQASASRMELPTVGLSTHIFSRMCSHAVMGISALPKSRWTRREFEHWDISAIAGHARAILEGYLLFWYLIEAPNSEDVQSAYVQTMHLYDCKKRISMKLFSEEDDLENFNTQEQEIRTRLMNTNTFQSLDRKLQRDILAGKKLMIKPKNVIIESANIGQQQFDFFWNYFSQYIHVYSYTFYRMEPEGRNSGIYNQFDLGALILGITFSTDILNRATDQIVEQFPDVANKRQGINSKFSPGPTRNLPKSRRKSKQTEKIARRKTMRKNTCNYFCSRLNFRPDTIEIK